MIVWSFGWQTVTFCHNFIQWTKILSMGASEGPSVVSQKSLYIRKFEKFFACHSRGSNRESIYLWKQKNLDSRLCGNDGQYTQTYVKKRWKHYTRIVKGLRIIVTARTHEQAIFQMPDVLTKGFRNFYYNSTANGYRRISVWCHWRKKSGQDAFFTDYDKDKKDSFGSEKRRTQYYGLFLPANRPKSGRQQACPWKGAG